MLRGIAGALNTEFRSLEAGTPADQAVHIAVGTPPR
jgi:hypothetical protein